MSVESSPHGARISRAASRIRTTRAAHRRQHRDLVERPLAQAGIGLERRGETAPVRQRLAEEGLDALHQQVEQHEHAGRPDHLVDDEGRERHVAAKRREADHRHRDPAEQPRGSADAGGRLGRHIGTEAGLFLVLGVREPVQADGEDERGRQGADAPCRDGDRQGCRDTGVQRLDGLHHHRDGGDADRQELEPGRRGITDRRGAPVRLVRAQQPVAQGLDGRDEGEPPEDHPRYGKQAGRQKIGLIEGVVDRVGSGDRRNRTDEDHPPRPEKRRPAGRLRLALVAPCRPGAMLRRPKYRATEMPKARPSTSRLPMLPLRENSRPISESAL